MTREQEAMVHVIGHLAPDPGKSLAGTVLYVAGETVPGVTVDIDWPTFLGRSAAEIDADRIAYLTLGPHHDRVRQGGEPGVRGEVGT